MGGIVTARELSKHSGNEEDINLVKILVFEKKESSLLSSSLPWVMVGQRKKSEITKPAKNIGISSGFGVSEP